MRRLLPPGASGDVQFGDAHHAAGRSARVRVPYRELSPRKCAVATAMK